MRSVEIAGAGYGRGVQLGRARAPRIRAHMDAWLDSLAQGIGGEPRAYVRGMLGETGFADLTKSLAPDLMEEVRGIADGADLDGDLVFAMQLIDEEWAYRARTRTAPKAGDKCSSIAVVSADGPTWIGQNMDLGSYTDGHQALVRVAADDGAPEALVFTLEGVIALMGVNAAGVGVCVNSIQQLPSAPRGLPVAFVIRRILACRSLGEAASLILGLPHATNQHYLVAEAGAARSFEASAEGVTEYQPPASDRITHTNHPLGAVKGKAGPPGAEENSAERLAALDRRIGDGAPDLAAIMDALCSCDDPRNPVRRVLPKDAGLINFTTGSMISALTSPVETWITAGPPTLDAYEHFTLTGETASA